MGSGNERWLAPLFSRLGSEDQPHQPGSRDPQNVDDRKKRERGKVHANPNKHHAEGHGARSLPYPFSFVKLDQWL